jgi:uncharacterized Zn finger protein (UPF0148 family)
MRYCPACGSLLDSEVETCPSCGSRATTVEARPAVDETTVRPSQPEQEEKRSPLARFIVPAIAVSVVVIAVWILVSSYQRERERVQDLSRPVLALLRANQARCVELDSDIRKLAIFATEQSEMEPIGAYLIDEGSLALAEIEASVSILKEITSAFENESAAPIEAIRGLLEAHLQFSRFLIDQPDGEPGLYATRSDGLLLDFEARKTEAEALVHLLRQDEGELLYAFQDRISEARDTALTYLLEEERKRSEAAFRKVEAEDATDMEQRIRELENYELVKAGLATRDERLRDRARADRKVDPLAPRPDAGPLPTGDEATPEELVLSAEARLWQPRVEEATRKTRAVSDKLLQMIRDRAYPPDLLGDCRELLAAVGQLPSDRIFPAPEPFLEKATQKAIDGWRVAAQQCLEENFFALDSNLTTSEESWLQIQNRIAELTSVD